MSGESLRDGTDRSSGLGDVATTFFRHKKKAFAFAATILSLATGVILFAPRTYRSEAKLFLQVGRESVRLDPTATTGKTIALQQAGRDSEVATVIEVLSSRAIVEKVVDRLAPKTVLGQGEGAADPSSSRIADALMLPVHKIVGAIKNIDPITEHEEAVIQIERNLDVDAEHESTLIVLTYDAETPQLAQKVLNEIVAVYREEHARLHQTTGSKTFFTEQRDSLETQLVAAEDALRTAKNRMGVGSIESRRSTLEDRLGSVEQGRNTTIQAIAAAEARVAALKERAEDMPERMHESTTTMPNTGADSLRSQLYALQVDLMNLKAKYNDDHPLVVSMQAQVDDALKMLKTESGSREQTVDTVNSNRRALLLELAQAESQLAGSEAQLAELDKQRSAALADLRKLNDYEVEIEALTRTATLARNDFYGYADNLEEARVDEELNQQHITNVAVAQAATAAEKPVSPSKLLVGALSLALASVGTVALVLGCEKLDGRVRSEDQVESVLRLPVLASVPEGRAYGATPAMRWKAQGSNT
jgi:polysaccharide biosynthesis protein PslE